MLDYSKKESLYEQIYKYIREEIINGSLKSEDKLPSSRALSQHLNVSRNTVDNAYSQLLSEGYIYSKPKRGYFVSSIEDIYISENQIHNVAEKEDDIQDGKCIDFSPVGVDMDHFPYDCFRRLYKETMSDNNASLFQNGNHQGEESLRQAICSYLHDARGVMCHSRQIVIGAGTDYLLFILTRILGNNKSIAMENYTYKQAYSIFEKLGYNTVPIDFDSSGMMISDLSKHDVDIAYVMPSHQFPMGTVMPINRRIELLNWAKEDKDRYIIEDDYDSEFRYQGRPIPSLHSSDKNHKVIYMGTFSKAVAPAIRVGYMVLPETILDMYYEHAGLFNATVSKVDQKVLEEFIVRGHFERHLNRMRGIYKTKHDRLINLIKHSKLPCSIMGGSAGLHILLKCDSDVDELKLVNEAKTQGLRIYGLDEYRIGKKTQPATIILGFARLDDKQIEEGVISLQKLFTTIYESDNIR